MGAGCWLFEREIRGRDPYKSIPAEDYFWRLARIEVPDDGWVSCPSPEHPDISPSCSVGDYRWRCFSCGHRGGIYDLASVLAHGPTGDALAGSREDFLRAVAAVRDEYGGTPRLRSRAAAVLARAHNRIEKEGRTP